jgi:membrane protein DedA with SNARE-associated domain
MLHELLRTWFHWVEVWGYWGVFILMAMESSIIPVPSEVVMPPAAFWAAQGRMDFVGVVVAGTAGSYLGSVLSYWISRWLGQPVILRYGRYFLLSPEKIALAEGWIQKFGSFGVLIARLLPVVRHLVSIPAGVLLMPFGRFSVSTLIGAGVWCAVLSWFGQEVIGHNPELLQSPEAMMLVIKAKMHWFLVAILILTILYSLVIYFKKGAQQQLRH